MKKLLLLPLLSACLLGVTSCGGSSGGDVSYQVTLDSNDSCAVQTISAITDVVANYYEGWTFRQYEDAFFKLSKDGSDVIYSNSRYGYTIKINKN